VRIAPASAEDVDEEPAPRSARASGAFGDDALIAAKHDLAEALDLLADVLGSDEVLTQIGDVDRANLAKYLTIAKLRLENAITVVRSGRPLQH